MTKKEIISRIRSIALRSSKFKIGETGLTIEKRLSLYNNEFKKIEKITFSKNKEYIDKIESEMNALFINWKNNKNDNTGSAGEMTDNTGTYILYVVYNLKPTKTGTKQK